MGIEEEEELFSYQVASLRKKNRLLQSPTVVVKIVSYRVKRVKRSTITGSRVLTSKQKSLSSQNTKECIEISGPYRGSKGT